MLSFRSPLISSHLNGFVRALLRGATVVFVLLGSSAFADSVRVVQSQGSMHGFLLLHGEDGKVIAEGDQIVVARGAQVRSRLVFHFRDGSVDDEITTFRQDGQLKMLTDWHIQKGPSFPKPLDMRVDVAKSEVTYTEFKDGKEERKTEHMDLPPDLANGLVSSVVENMPAGSGELKVSYLTASPKPRVVKLVITPDGGDRFFVGGARRQAKQYRIHVDLGGVAGVIAPVIGKQPTDIEMWVAGGEVPAFVKLRGALYEQGPIWTMELTSPRWQSGSGADVAR